VTEGGAKGWLRRRLSRLLFERRLDVDTAGVYTGEETALPHEDYLWYEPMPWLSLRSALRRHKVSGEDVFIDLGCGKGRAVLQAARYPFKRVIGVELDPELTEVARANVEANLPRLKCREIELTTADLTEYTLPDDVTLAYCFNSVTGEPFGSLLSELLRSVDRRPRRLVLIYLNPKEHERVVGTGRARPLGDYPQGWLRRYPMRVYELLPDNATA
jgi:SAM-dependent methyltransferase